MNDSLVVITADQLKIANSIFLEHALLKTTNSELENEVANYKVLYEDELRIDSLYNTVVFDLEKELDCSKKRLKIWKITSCSTILLLLGACLL